MTIFSEFCHQITYKICQNTKTGHILRAGQTGIRRANPIRSLPVHVGPKFVHRFSTTQRESSTAWRNGPCEPEAFNHQKARCHCSGCCFSQNEEDPRHARQPQYSRSGTQDFVQITLDLILNLVTLNQILYK